MKEKLLEDYKRANKERRKKLLEKYGFISEEKFYEFLGQKKVSKDKKDNKSIEIHDAVICFDTTGSMRSYIASVRKHVEEVINDMFAKVPNLKMKIVAFGDYCDMPSKDVFGKAYQETQLTDNKEELINFVQSAQNTNGGDSEEFYELVIKKVIEETPWRSGKRTVLFIADDHPHPLGYSCGQFIQDNQIDWIEEAKKAACKGIQFDTLRIHPEVQWYKELSDITRGVCMNFKNSDKISEIVTGTIYARSSKEAFTAAYTSALASGDEELIGAYKTMSTL